MDAANCAQWTTIWQALSTLAIFGGSGVAITAIISNRKTARSKAAIDYLTTAHENQRLKDCINSIRKLHHDPDVHIESYAYDTKRDSDEADAIRYLLNHFEYLSVGISQGIYDEETIKLSRYTVIMQVWTMSLPFILKVRELNDKGTIYQEFQALTYRWKANKLKIRHSKES